MPTPYNDELMQSATESFRQQSTMNRTRLHRERSPYFIGYNTRYEPPEDGTMVNPGAF